MNGYRGTSQIPIRKPLTLQQAEADVSHAIRPSIVADDSAFSHDSAGRLPPLEPGDHLDQPTFHARYEAMPEDVQAELIGGVVYMPAALRRPHGRWHGKLIHWLHAYEEATPGVEAYHNATTILAEDSEPQPDACLIVLPEKGGQTRFTPDEYLAGAPELAVEVASSTEAYDLHSKKRDYERAGVREYLVVALRQRHVVWLVNEREGFTDLPVNGDGIVRSRVFPGLWLDVSALWELDGRRMLQVLAQGTATAEHERFVKRLAQANRDQPCD